MTHRAATNKCLHRNPDLETEYVAYCQRERGHDGNHRYDYEEAS